MKTTTTLAALSMLLVSLAGTGAADTLAANAGADKTVDVGATVSFDGTASTGSVSAYNWDFGDGSTGTGPTASHAYSTAGTFTVTLLVVSDAGSTSTDTATVVVRTTDSVAPTITHTNVTSGVANAAVSISATVTDNVAVQTVSVYYKKASESSFVSTTLARSGSTTTFTGEIPASVATETIHYYLRAIDTRSPTPNAATWPANAPTAYVTVSLTDTSAPAITTTAVSSVVAGQSLAVTATITDNVVVSSAKMYYRFATSGTFSNASMTASGSSYSASVTVPSSGVTDVQYYVEARDAAGNVARAPTSAPTTPTSVGVTSAAAPTVTHTAPATATAGADLPISATIAAASGRAISSAILYYRAIGATDWSQATMTNFTSASSYSSTIPGASIGDRGVEYAIEATDTAAAVGKSPSAGRTSPQQLATPPGAVSGLSVARASSGVVATWTAATSTATSSVGSYKLYRSTSPTTGFSVLATPASATATDSAASSGVRYWYAVSAVDAYGAEGALSSAVASARGVAPTAPSGLALAATASGALSLSWTASSGAGWYVVEKSLDGAAWSQAANTTSASTTLTGLTDGVAVLARVTAWNPWNEVGGTSSAATGTPIAAPSAVSGLAASRTTAGVALSWTPLAATQGMPVTAYSVQRATSASGTFTEIARQSGTTATDATAAEGIAYSYRVIAVNDLGAGAASAAVASARGVAPTAPASLALAPSAAGALAATWTAPASAARYVVETSSDGVTWATAAEATSASATLSGLASGTLVRARVTAWNAFDEVGGTSAVATATPLDDAPAPASLAVERTSAGAALAWPASPATAAAPVTSYAILRSASASSGFAQIATVDASALSHEDASAAPGVRYYYRIAAANALGLGGLSPVASSALGPAPAAPTLALSTGDGEIVASWGAVANAAYYLVEKSSDGATWTRAANTTLATATLTALPNGALVHVRVVPANAWGETGAASATRTATPTAPAAPAPAGAATPAGAAAPAGSVTIAFPAPGALVSGPIVVRGASTTGAAVTVASSDGRSIAATGTDAWSAPWDPSGLADGAYVLTVSSGSAKQELVVQLDRAAPTLELLAPVGDVSAGAVAIHVLARDASPVTVEVTLDGKAVALSGAAGSFGGAASGVAAGEHTLRALARDAAGHETARAWTFRATQAVERPALALGLAAGPAEGAIVASDPVLRVTFPAGLGLTLEDFTIAINGKPAAATIADGALAIPIDATGPVDVRVALRDELGNEATLARRFTVDATAPALALEGLDGASLLARVDDASGLDAASLRVTLDGADVTRRATLAGGALRVDATGIAPGAHAWTVSVRDAVGNEAAAEGSFTVDAPTPERADAGSSPSTSETQPPAPAKKRWIPGSGAALAAIAVALAALAVRRRR